MNRPAACWAIGPAHAGLQATNEHAACTGSSRLEGRALNKAIGGKKNHVADAYVGRFVFPMAINKNELLRVLFAEDAALDVFGRRLLQEIELTPRKKPQGIQHVRQQRFVADAQPSGNNKCLLRRA